MADLTRLDAALPGAQFSERHERVIGAPVDAVWEALLGTHYLDLRLSRPLLLARTLGRMKVAADDPGQSLLGEHAPTPMLYAEKPTYVAGGRVAKPWQPAPALGPVVTTLTELRQVQEPGWVKLGMDFALEPMAAGWTRLTTVTLVEATDEAARHRFARYWRLIRPFSGLIRREMLRAVARAATSSTS